MGGSAFAAGFALRPAEPEDLAALMVIDDRASELFAAFGMEFHLAPDHPFVVQEVLRWQAAIALGRAVVAVEPSGDVVGFVTLGHLDGAPYLDQLSVHPNAMRRGIGGALIERALALAGGEPVWLTTFGHIPWNRPYYEQFGFRVVPDEHCGPELRSILEAQRAVLPDPEHRLAMVR